METAILTRSDTIALAAPLPLDCGRALDGVRLAYEAYGTLNDARDNAILITHALTGDQYVASTHPKTGKPGWWARMVGAGLPIDTDRYFVICANVLGSCMGSTGPASVADDGQPWAMRFPVITIRDMVRGHIALLDALGIERLHAVVPRAHRRRAGDRRHRSPFGAEHRFPRSGTAGDHG